MPDSTSPPDPPSPSPSPAPPSTTPEGEAPGSKGPKSIFDRAKGAVSAAADGAAALKGRASGAISTISEQASKKAQEMIGSGLEQVTGVAADLNAALPVIKLAGFALDGVSLTASLTPNVVATFQVENKVTDEQVETIEKEHADNTLAIMMIRALRRASKLQDKLAFGSLKAKHLSIAIGLSPSVSLSFG